MQDLFLTTYQCEALLKTLCQWKFLSGHSDLISSNEFYFRDLQILE